MCTCLQELQAGISWGYPQMAVGEVQQKERGKMRQKFPGDKYSRGGSAHGRLMAGSRQRLLHSNGGSRLEVTELFKCTAQV